MTVKRIAVFGSIQNTSNKQQTIAQAQTIGREIAERGLELVTGGGFDLPYEAVLAAHEAGGRCIAFSPAKDLHQHTDEYKFPSKGFSRINYMGYQSLLLDVLDDPSYIAESKEFFKKLRNVFSVRYADAGIIIGGGMGTMNEFALLHGMGKNIGIMNESGGITKEAISVLLRDSATQSKSKIIRQNDAAKLVEMLANL